MATIIGTGISTELDSFAAGKEAALSAYSKIGKNEPTIIITFISAIFNQEIVLKGIYSVIKNTPLIGCSSFGSISTYGFHRDSVAVFIVSSSSIKFFTGLGHRVSLSPRSAGYQAAKQASSLTHSPKQAYIMFSNNIMVNSSDVLRGSQEVLGTSFPIIGGGSSNKQCAEKTYQYMDNKVYTDSVAGLLLSGDIKLGIGQANGWQPIGKPHKITKAKQNTIKEIDKKIAAELYNEYFEKSFDEIKNNGICKLGINYPIGTHLTNKNKEYLTRTPLAIEENGSLILNADIHEEEDISLMIGDKEIILESAKNAVSTALNHINNERIGFAVIFSDISRLLLLRKNAYKEIDIIKDAIGKNIPILGCYTFGEYGPFEIEQSKDQYYFNNHSICIALFSE